MACSVPLACRDVRSCPVWDAALSRFAHYSLSKKLKHSLCLLSIHQCLLWSRNLTFLLLEANWKASSRLRRAGVGFEGWEPWDSPSHWAKAPLKLFVTRLLLTELPHSLYSSAGMGKWSTLSLGVIWGRSCGDAYTSWTWWAVKTKALTAGEATVCAHECFAPLVVLTACEFGHTGPPLEGMILKKSSWPRCDPWDFISQRPARLIRVWTGCGSSMHGAPNFPCLMARH